LYWFNSLACHSLQVLLASVTGETASCQRDIAADGGTFVLVSMSTRAFNQRRLAGESYNDSWPIAGWHW